MSRTDRDHKKYVYKHHRDHCTDFVQVEGSRFYIRSQGCECRQWDDYHWYNFPPPSWWHKGIRRKERAFTRNKMDRARAGSADWSAADDRRGDEYYW